MQTFFMYFGMAAGTFLFVLAVLAFLHFKQGKVRSAPVTMFTRYANSRHNGVFSKISYFAFPLLVLLFWSGIGGLLAIAAMIMGIFFSKKLAAADSLSTTIKTASQDPIAGDLTDPRNIA